MIQLSFSPSLCVGGKPRYGERCLFCNRMPIYGGFFLSSTYRLGIESDVLLTLDYYQKISKF